MALPAKDPYPAQALTEADLVSGGTEASGGFEGSISNLTFSDVVQLQGQNLFSGSIRVVYQEQEGHVFFQQGEIVHAELGNYIGEDAFNRIMGWPGGGFRLQPNVTSLRQTIQKRREHLLLSAHQWLDEARHGMVDPGAIVGTAPSSSLAARPVPTKSIAQVISEVPGVSHAVFMDRDGTPLGDVTAREEEVAAKGLYLATMIGAKISEALGLGELQTAAMHAGPEKLLLFWSQETCLSVCVARVASPEEVESGIRHALAARKEGR